MAKKIIATISLVLIGLLIVATIVMANVKVDYSVRCNAPDDIIVVTPSGSMPDPSTEQEQEIVKLISNASKRSSLSALFDGALFDKARIEDVNSSNASRTTIVKKSNCYYVQYVYNEAQVLKYGKEDYKDANGSLYYYKRLWFEVPASNEEEVTVYIVPWFDTDGVNKNPKSDNYTKVKKVSADLTALYDYLKTL